MNKLSLILCALSLVLPIASLAEATKDIKCQIDIISGGKKQNVPVYVVPGKTTKPIKFNGHEFSVNWFKGDKYETQTYLSMKFGDLTSTMYDISPEQKIGPFNVMVRGNVRFQCGPE